MTEAEAKEKSCCGPPAVYAAVAALVAVTAQTNDKGFQGSVTINVKCIGSACMAWQLDPRAISKDGYCGLAGLPNF